MPCFPLVFFSQPCVSFPNMVNPELIFALSIVSSVLNEDHKQGDVHLERLLGFESRNLGSALRSTSSQLCDLRCIYSLAHHSKGAGCRTFWLNVGLQGPLCR